MIVDLSNESLSETFSQAHLINLGDATRVDVWRRRLFAYLLSGGARCAWLLPGLSVLLTRMRPVFAFAKEHTAGHPVMKVRTSGALVLEVTPDDSLRQRNVPSWDSLEMRLVYEDAGHPMYSEVPYWTKNHGEDWSVETVVTAGNRVMFTVMFETEVPL